MINQIESKLLPLDNNQSRHINNQEENLKLTKNLRQIAYCIMTKKCILASQKTTHFQQTIKNVYLEKLFQGENNFSLPTFNLPPCIFICVISNVEEDGHTLPMMSSNASWLDENWLHSKRHTLTGRASQLKTVRLN